MSAESERLAAAVRALPRVDIDGWPHIAGMALMKAARAGGMIDVPTLRTLLTHCGTRDMESIVRATLRATTQPGSNRQMAALSRDVSAAASAAVLHGEEAVYEAWISAMERAERARSGDRNEATSGSDSETTRLRARIAGACGRCDGTTMVDAIAVEYAIDDPDREDPNAEPQRGILCELMRKRGIGRHDEDRSAMAIAIVEALLAHDDERQASAIEETARLEPRRRPRRRKPGRLTRTKG